MTDDSPAPTAVKRTRVKKRTLPGPLITDEHGIVRRTNPRAKKPGPRKGKYNAKGKHVDGKWFASTAEAIRYEQLKELVASGAIEDLELQVKYPVTMNNRHITNYLADFRYKVVDELGRTLRVVVEDVKGMMTDLYELKRKLVEAQHFITICEIPARKVTEWAGRLP